MSVRHVLYTHIATICLMAGFIQADRHGLVDWQNETLADAILLSFSWFSVLSMYGFPILFLIVLVRSSLSIERKLIALSMELLLIFGHFVAMLPGVI